MRSGSRSRAWNARGPRAIDAMGCRTGIARAIPPGAPAIASRSGTTGRCSPQGSGSVSAERLPASSRAGCPADTAAIRHPALNIVKEIPDRASLNIRRKTLGWDEDHRFAARTHGPDLTSKRSPGATVGRRRAVKSFSPRKRGQEPDQSFGICWPSVRSDRIPKSRKAQTSVAMRKAPG